MTGVAPLPDRYLCVCADDFGISEGVNSAVLSLSERRSISATACMVERAAWRLGAIGLRALRPGHLEVGLHLDLTTVPQSAFSEASLASLVVRSHLGLLRPARIRDQIRNQLSRFEDGLGRRPCFVDGHRHVHQLPVVRDALVEELASRYQAPLPWIRSTAASRRRAAEDTSKAEVIFALGGSKLLEAARLRAVPTSSALLGVYDFTGGADGYRSRLLRWLQACRTGDVLMCHPSRGTPSDPLDLARRAEYEVLREIEFPFESPNGVVRLSSIVNHSGLSHELDPQDEFSPTGHSPIATRRRPRGECAAR